MRKRLVLIMFIALMVTSCSLKEKDSLNDVSTTSIESSEETEVNTMKREFCVVDKIDKAQFVLKNTSDELYYIDNSYLGEFKEGDTVLLIYKERSKISDGKYNTDIYAIYHDDYKLVENR